MLRKFHRLISSCLIVVVLTVSFLLSSPTNASAGIPIDLKAVTNLVKEFISNKQLSRDAKNFINDSPKKICSAYVNMKNGRDNSKWNNLVQEGGFAIFTIGQKIAAVSPNAGALTSYAGMASAISELGLGGVTQVIAGFLGSNAVGAAATAVVTSTVGGPIVMAGLVSIGLGVTAVGTGELTKLVAHKLGDWAESSCYVQSSR